MPFMRFKVFCDCGQDLSDTAKDKGDGSIIVGACKVCMDAACDEGYNEGYYEGANANLEELETADIIQIEEED